MSQACPKNPLSKDSPQYPNSEVQFPSHKHRKIEHQSLLIFHQDSDSTPKQIYSKIQSKPSEDPHSPEAKQEYSDSIQSSLMDLDDIISDPNQQFDPPIYFESDSSQSLRHKKTKKINKKKQKPDQIQSTHIKIQHQESSSYNEDKQDRQKGNRKVRTTINEQKIKIMEYLFPYVAKQKPYKGTILSLKDVGKIVDLGYSTILHKYRDYREKGQIEKGLLLKCKNFKRKYNKSLILETFIKRALKESEFKTAKQLAVFISENYHVKANRSIISRHLNEMQREKTKNKIQDKIIRVPGQKKQLYLDSEALKKLKQFCLVYLGLQNQKIQFQYLTVIRVYLVESRLCLTLENKDNKFSVMDLIITASEQALKEYHIYFINEESENLGNQSSNYDDFAYKALYNKLEIEIQNHYLDMTFQNEEKAFIVYPFKNGKKENDYRFKMIKDLIDKKISILTVPPAFNIKSLNFVKQWFQKEVFSSIKQSEFQNSLDCRDTLVTLMNSKQGSLKSYANLMQMSIKNF